MSDTALKRARTGSVLSECRACLGKIKDDSSCVDLFCAWDPSWSGMGASIAEDLIKISNIQISASDPHSKHICKRCCIRLQDAIDFTLKVQKNDLILRNQHKESCDEDPQWPKPIQVDKNILTNNEMTVEVKQEMLSEDEYETGNESIQPDLEIKIEPEEITPMGVTSAEIEFDEPAVKKVKTSNGPSELLVEREFDDVKEEPVSEDECEQGTDIAKDCMLCLKTFNTVKGLKAHVIAVHSYNTFTSPKVERKNVCTTCNRSFATRTDLFVHETCHSKFACYVCDRKFDTFQLLTKHRTSCMRTSEIPRLKTLEDVRRPPINYITDKQSPITEQKPAIDQDITIHSQLHKESNPSSVETKPVLEPVDPAKYKIEEILTLEHSFSDELPIVNEKSTEKLSSRKVTTESIDHSNDIMENESEKPVSTEETNSSNIILDIIDITDKTIQKLMETDTANGQFESKKVEDIERVEPVISNNNKVSLKSGLSNHNTEVDRTEVIEKENEKIGKESKLNIDNKLSEASSQINIDTPEEIDEKKISLSEIRNEIKENIKLNSETFNENFQELNYNENDGKLHTDKIVESLESSANEDSLELKYDESDTKSDNISEVLIEKKDIYEFSFETLQNEGVNKNDNIPKVRNEITEIVKSLKDPSNKDCQELVDHEGDIKNDNISKLIIKINENVEPFQTPPNIDGLESHESENKLEVCNTEEMIKPTFEDKLKSLETCANEANVTELTDNKLKDLVEMNLENENGQCKDMEIELEIHSMDGEEEMDIDHFESEIIARSESDKHT